MIPHLKRIVTMLSSKSNYVVFCKPTEIGCAYFQDVPCTTQEIRAAYDQVGAYKNYIPFKKFNRNHH